MEQGDTELPPRRPYGRMVPSQRRHSQEDQTIPVVFPGLVTRESCYRFTCELLKHIFHQRHQIPLPYEQLLGFTKTPQEDAGKKRSRADVSESHNCRRTMSQLEELICQLEIFFTITPVPRVLLLLGGNSMNPKEMYDLNMEGVNVGNGEQSLSTRPCLRQLFRALFQADPFSDLRSSPLMSLVVMAQGQRQCGTDWFLPKLSFRVPSRGRTLTIKMSCADCASLEQSSEDYIWFQAPITIKGFQN
ncbi:hypothetical protein GDO86_018891 [Hymenochirus boettgeri]|uniref:MAD2L1-binding protein n=1 Tax=Hymenochirus boettgeri TaxID=247094 RepID=A0A8T2IJX9_9PIPI|nr:hypothetical protein GDO86_018891 [Hymenochirus boettgeri]